MDEAEPEDADVEGDEQSLANDLNTTHIEPMTSNETLAKGQRKARKTNANNQRQGAEKPVSSVDVLVETVEDLDENGEDAEMEDAADGVNMDVTAKNEEYCK